MTPEEIKALRFDLGRTQKGMAKVLGTSITTIQRYESGKARPLPIFLAKLQNLRKLTGESYGDFGT